MERIRILAILLLAVIVSLPIPASLAAQNSLERISVSERSDGQGFVVRAHLEAPADSFLLAQPAPDLVQIMIYSPELDTSDFIPPDENEFIQNIEYHRNRSGFGMDIFLREGSHYKADAYPDRNGSHLLLSLKKSSADEIAPIVAESDFIYWYNYEPIRDNSSYEFISVEQDQFFPEFGTSGAFDVIVIDAGHGGHDPGAMNRSLGLREKDIALSVALKVGEYINEHLPDVEVIYTRDDDTFVKLQDRGLTATRARGNLFLSIHVNSARNPSAHGAEIFFLGLARSESALEVMKRENSVVNLENNGGPEQLSEEELLIYELANAGNIAISERIASMIENQFRTRAQRRSRGIKQAGLMALWHASTPAVLVELGFISNPNEARYLASDYGQTILASAIFRAIRDFKLEYDKSQRQPNRASND